MKPLLFAFPGQGSLSAHVIAALAAESGALDWHRFPDGESLIRLDTDCRNRDVAIVCTLRDPDWIVLPLLFAARTARALGALRVGLIAPYLAYMRQDARFHQGEALSSAEFAALLSWTFDWLVTVDPHLHRRADLSEIFSIPARHVSAAPLVAEWIRLNVPNAVLIGPDGESAQWVHAVAERIGAPMTVLEKRRHGDRDVDVSLPDRSVLADRTPVLVDDIVSSGRTLIETLGHLKRLGLPPAVCVAVHGVFADASDRALLAAGAARVVSSNTIAHSTNAIDVCTALTPAIRAMFDGH
jgi:ribose-phosphate pyrophosphokinase